MYRWSLRNTIVCRYRTIHIEVLFLVKAEFSPCKITRRKTVHKDDKMNTLFNSPGYVVNNSAARGFASHGARQAELDQGHYSAHNNSQRPTQLLENQISRKIPELSQLTQNSKAGFGSQAVAERILDSVETAIRQRAGSELEAQSMLQQAKEGISQGFAEARKILSELPQMTQEIDAQIDKTESLIFQGLDDLTNTLIDSAQQPGLETLISETSSLSTKFEQNRTASIEIMTQDGDKVEVSYSAFIESASSENHSINQQGSFSSYEFSSISSAAFQFSVQGDIDEGEQQAIDELLNKVGNLASQFFNGDVQAAFNSAMELGFDSGELKSFALDFQQSTHVELVQNYKRTEQYIESTPAIATTGPAPAIDILSQLEDLIEQQNDNQLIEQAESTIKSLLKDMLNLVNKDQAFPAHRFINEIIENS